MGEVLARGSCPSERGGLGHSPFAGSFAAGSASELNQPYAQGPCQNPGLVYLKDATSWCVAEAGGFWVWADLPGFRVAGREVTSMS